MYKNDRFACFSEIVKMMKKCCYCHKDLVLNTGIVCEKCKSNEAKYGKVPALISYVNQSHTNIFSRVFVNIVSCLQHFLTKNAFIAVTRNESMDHRYGIISAVFLPEHYFNAELSQ